MGYRKTEPAHGRPSRRPEVRAVGRGGVGDAAPEVQALPPVHRAPVAHQQGDILFATRTVDPEVAAVEAEARRSGLWASAEVTDALWPAGHRTAPGPLMPLRRGATWPCWWPPASSTTSCWRPTGRRILVKGRTSKEMEMVEDSPGKEVHRERLLTTVVALDLGRGQITDIAS